MTDKHTILGNFVMQFLLQYCVYIQFMGFAYFYFLLCYYYFYIHSSFLDGIIYLLRGGHLVTKTNPGKHDFVLLNINTVSISALAVTVVNQHVSLWAVWIILQLHEQVCKQSVLCEGEAVLSFLSRRRVLESLTADVMGDHWNQPWVHLHITCNQDSQMLYFKRTVQHFE